MKEKEIIERQDVPEDIKKHLLRYIKKYDQIMEELHESDEWHRTIIQSAPYGILRVDINGKIIETNGAYCHMCGYDKNELTNMTIADLEVIYTASEISNHLQKLMTQGQYRFETQHRRKDRSVFDVEVAVQCQSLEKSLFIIYLNDITERKFAEEERLKRQKEETTEILAGGLAHDFNNLLTIIIGNLSILIFAENNAIKRKHLEDAMAAALRGVGLTGKMSILTKKNIMEKKIGSIAKVIRDSAELSLSGGSGCKCELDLAEDLMFVDMDSVQIGQVIQNLMINADRAMFDSKEKIIRVRAKNIKLLPRNIFRVKSGKYIHISVIDSGVGIAPENLEKIFDPYYTTKKKTDVVSGLGLATINVVVKKHGGFCIVESEEKKGSTFHVYLPAVDRDELAVAEAVKQDQSIFRSLKILVMDDELPIRKIIQHMLSNLGHQVWLVEDGEEALDIYSVAQKRGKPFDLVILDLTIPGGMDGIKTLEKIKEIDPNVVAVISSGYPIDTMKDFSDTLPKPYKEGQVRDLISRIFR